MKANKERLYNDVSFLTSLVPARNYRNKASLDKTCDYIEKELEKAGVTTERQSWRADGMEYHNVMASYNQGKHGGWWWARTTMCVAISREPMTMPVP
jgi:hypothetical protein